MQSRGIQNRRTAPGWLTVMGIFAKIGTTSFGGGSATIAAIRQACIRHGWMSEQQFIEIVVLSRLTPGISILAQTLLIGRAVAGIAGMFAALIGLLTPSLIITVALAKLYQVINTLPSTATPLHAIVATAAGFAVAMTLQLSRDVFRDRRVRATAIILIIYIALAFLIVNPLYVMGISIVLGLAFPKVFAKLEQAGAEQPPDTSKS